MADLGQDEESLKIKVLEAEVTIGDKEFSKKRIQLEKMRLAQRDHELDKSIQQIDEQIAQHKIDHQDLLNAVTKL